MPYIRYSDRDQVASLDQNTYDSRKSTVFPRGLYSGNAVPVAQYACTRPRDTETHYIINRERDDHPDHFSRFGYGRCRYGYCYGHHPGRYQVSECSAGAICGCSDPQPPAMAPEKYYSGQFQGLYVVASVGNVDHNLTKNYGMKHP